MEKKEKKKTEEKKIEKNWSVCPYSKRGSGDLAEAFQDQKEYISKKERERIMREMPVDQLEVKAKKSVKLPEVVERILKKEFKRKFLGDERFWDDGDNLRRVADFLEDKDYKKKYGEILKKGGVSEKVEEDLRKDLKIFYGLHEPEEE